MDLKLYYQKIRDAEAKIVDEFPVVISRETPDGGKEGTLTEVPRRTAAKMLVDGLAQVASQAEKEAFQAAQADAKQLADQLAAAAQVKVTVLSSADLDKLKSARSTASK